jgi:peptidoglycan/xylan/chitin deacetylase (PgdA/CDA1 family)
MLAPLVSILPDKYVMQRLPAAVAGSLLLTFDDGPTPGVTERLLDLLDEHDARAIFFTVGIQIEKAPQLVRLVRERGHQLGNHSHAHNMSRLQTPRFFLDDLERCQQLIRNTGGGECRFFRAPGGRLTPMSIFGPRSRGLQHILWSLDSGDWSVRQEEDARRLGRRLAQQAGDGEIILFHDFHQSILAIMEEFLPRVRARGLDLRNSLSHLVDGEHE